MNHGIKYEYWKKLEMVFRNHENIKEVILYGSRAKGTNRQYSDVDIVLVGEKITSNEYSVIDREIDDLLLPFFFDISIYHTLTNSNLLESINQTGVVVYKNKKLVFENTTDNK